MIEQNEFNLKVQQVMIREAGKTLTDIIDEAVPNGLKKTLALNKVEEAIMWATSAIKNDRETDHHGS